MIKFLLKYWKSIIISIIITFLCFIPGNEISQPKLKIPHLDKFVHFGFYFALSFIIQYELQNKIKLKNYLYIFIYSIFLGGLIEIVQKYIISSRGGDLYDLFADLLGALFAFFVYKIFYFLREKIFRI